jgi:hypothetical protein
MSAVKHKDINGNNYSRRMFTAGRHERLSFTNGSKLAVAPFLLQAAPRSVVNGSHYTNLFS